MAANPPPEPTTISVCLSLGTTVYQLDKWVKTDKFQLPKERVQQWLVWTDRDISRLKLLVEDEKKRKATRSTKA